MPTPTQPPPPVPCVNVPQHTNASIHNGTRLGDQLVATAPSPVNATVNVTITSDGQVGILVIDVAADHAVPLPNPDLELRYVLTVSFWSDSDCETVHVPPPVLSFLVLFVPNVDGHGEAHIMRNLTELLCNTTIFYTLNLTVQEVNSDSQNIVNETVIRLISGHAADECLYCIPLAICCAPPQPTPPQCPGEPYVKTGSIGEGNSEGPNTVERDGLPFVATVNITYHLNQSLPGAALFIGNVLLSEVDQTFAYDLLTRVWDTPFCLGAPDVESIVADIAANGPATNVQLDLSQFCNRTVFYSVTLGATCLTDLPDRTLLLTDVNGTGTHQQCIPIFICCPQVPFDPEQCENFTFARNASLVVEPFGTVNIDATDTFPVNVDLSYALLFNASAGQAQLQTNVTLGVVPVHPPNFKYNLTRRIWSDNACSQSEPGVLLLQDTDQIFEGQTNLVNPLNLTQFCNSTVFLEMSIHARCGLLEIDADLNVTENGNSCIPLTVCCVPPPQPPPAPCPPPGNGTCGDGVIDAGEECDQSFHCQNSTCLLPRVELNCTVILCNFTNFEGNFSDPNAFDGSDLFTVFDTFCICAPNTTLPTSPPVPSSPTPTPTPSVTPTPAPSPSEPTPSPPEPEPIPSPPVVEPPPGGGGGIVLPDFMDEIVCPATLFSPTNVGGLLLSAAIVAFLMLILVFFG